MKLKTLLVLFIATVFSSHSWAEQFVTIKDVEVHYSAFNSTLLPAKVTRLHKLKRNGYYALLNVSILDTRQARKPAIEANIDGRAKNLLGQSRELEFKPIREGQSVYYIAEIFITNEETLTFDIQIDAGLSGKGKLSFTQKFYVEE